MALYEVLTLMYAAREGAVFSVFGGMLSKGTVNEPLTPIDRIAPMVPAEHR